MIGKGHRDHNSAYQTLITYAVERRKVVIMGKPLLTFKSYFKWYLYVAEC